MNNSLKTAMHMTVIHLNTVDGSPMTVLGIMMLQLRIADFKFSHNFIVCYRLPEMELLFGINVQEKILPILCLGQKKELLHTKGG